MTKEFCNSVITIPQISGTCWFNSLMMIIFYSQNSRKLLLYYKPFKGRRDILSRTLKSILYKNYKLDEKTIQFFNENTIDSILSKFNLRSEIIDYIFKNGYLIPFFIPYFFDVLNVNYLTIDFFNSFSYSLNGNLQKDFYFSISETVSIYNDEYNNLVHESILNDPNGRIEYKKFIKNKIENYVPLYLIINIFDNFDYLYAYFGSNTTQILKEFNIFNGFDFSISGIYELLNEITFNGKTYILDSVALGNYNADEIKLGHSIAGITCKNNKYVYNGWIRNTNDPGIKYKIDRTLPCELMSYEWDINKNNEFCINSSVCDLKNTGYIDRFNDLCFSFNRGNRTLIYILKNEEYKSLDYNRSKSSSFLKSKSNSYNQEIKRKEEIKKKKEEIKKSIKETKKKLNKYFKYRKELDKLIDSDKKKLVKLLEKYKKYN
jgi:hypothetical protein